MGEEKNKEKKSVPQRLINYAKKYYEKLKENEVKQLFKAKVIECFELGEMYRKYEGVQIYPQIVRIGLLENGIEAVLNLPRGFKPGDLEEKSYVFEQEFGQNIELKKVSSKTFVLYVFMNNPLKEKYDYQLMNFKHNLPIYVGKDSRGKTISYDMIAEPHLLIAGETGSGKSVILRSILTTLIFNKTPEELKLYLFDLKKSEFFLFKRLPHVVENTYNREKMKKRFGEILKDLSDRGDLLEKHEVPHIDELPKEVKPPYIMVFIDEFSLINDVKAIVDSIEDITAIGRALGIFIVLSTQRPDSKILEGRIKALLTVRIGGRQQDAVNSKIVIDCGGCEKLTSPGHMKMKSILGLIDIKVPMLDYKVAKEMLNPLRIEKAVEEEPEEKEEIKPAKRKKSTKKGKEKKPIVWGVLGEQKR
ncbi:DNA translocase FtsK [Arthrobacter citreus]|nr:DNA translocase FtsK [Arthrobacter citreus]